MGAELAIDIEVMISDELRDLMRQRRGGFKPVEAPVPVVHLPAAPSPQLPERHIFALRQDGARPLTFHGLPLFEIRTQVHDLPGTADLHLALFLSEGERVHVGLSIHPPEASGARPIFRAASLTDGESFAQLLRDFAPETCLETALTADPGARATHATARRAIRAAFTSMAAACLTKGMLPA